MSALVDELRELIDGLRSGVRPECGMQGEIELFDIDGANQLMDEAADALTTLQSRLEEKEASWEATRKAVATLNNENGQLRSRLEAVEAARDALRQKLFPYADATEISGMSWEGLYLIGDKKSISKLRQIENDAAQIEIYRKAFEERAAVAEARVKELQKALNRCEDMNSRLRFPDNTGQ